MAFVPGAGIRFAVPDVQNIKTDNWALAVGAVAFGPQAEVYRVFGINETATQSTTVAANNLAVIQTNSAAISNTSILNAIAPFICQISNSATGSALGIFAQSVASNKLAWVQVAGAFTANLTSSAHASLANAFFLPFNATQWQTTASANAIGIQTAAYAWNGPVQNQTAQTTARLHLMGAPAIALWNGKFNFSA